MPQHRDRTRLKRKYRDKIINPQKSAEKEIEKIWNHRSIEKIS